MVLNNLFFCVVCGFCGKLLGIFLREVFKFGGWGLLVNLDVNLVGLSWLNWVGVSFSFLIIWDMIFMLVGFMFLKLMVLLGVILMFSFLILFRLKLFIVSFMFRFRV